MFLVNLDNNIVIILNDLEEEIKGLILFLASGRKNWDRCLVTVFHILDANSD